MAKARRRSFEREYLQVPNETAQAPEIKTKTPSISLEALGLLVNICSYSEEWELHKTELYKRFTENKRTSVGRAWKELCEKNYIFEYKYRSGKKWEHVYIYNLIPYTAEQIEVLRNEAINEFGQIWDVDFAHPKMDTPKCAPQNQQLIKNKEKKDSIKEIQTKEILKSPKPLTQELDYFSLKLPMQLKKFLEGNREKGLEVKIDILEIENFYNTHDRIKPNCEKEDIFHLNDFEFTNMIKAIYKEMNSPIKNTHNLLYQWVNARLFHKYNNYGLKEKES